MPFESGVPFLISAGSTTVKLGSTSASGGVPPYTQQWTRSANGGPYVTLEDATELTLNDTNLIPNTIYDYIVIYTDSSSEYASGGPAIATTFPPSLSLNQFAMVPIPGDIDLLTGPKNVAAAQVDASQETPLYPGQPIIFVNNNNGIPTIIAAGVNMPNGYILYDQKSQNFPAGSRCEISKTGSCIWLYATTAITRGSQVCLDQFIPTGVQATTGLTNLPIVGEAYDQATEFGQLIRVILNVPSYSFDTTFNILSSTSQTFLSGSGTYVLPQNPTPKSIRIQMAAAGGGGGGATGETTAGTAGTDGGDTTFGTSQLIAEGGAGGQAGNLALGGAGGESSFTIGSGDAFIGQDGDDANSINYVSSVNINNISIAGGRGGQSLYNGVQGASGLNGKNAMPNTGCGGGGGGGRMGNGTGRLACGGAGGGGGYLDVVIINPDTEYTFSVGASGIGGDAGSGAFGLYGIGGNGAAGIIKVTEYYQ